MLQFSYWPQIQLRDPSHIYEMRSYRLKPGTMIEWGNNWARGINYRQANDVPFAGFFSQIGRLYNVHHIWCKFYLEFYKDLFILDLFKTWICVNIKRIVPLFQAISRCKTARKAVKPHGELLDGTSALLTQFLWFVKCILASWDQLNFHPPNKCPAPHHHPLKNWFKIMHLYIFRSHSP